MRLVLLGAPASGKGTQGDILAQRLGIPKISTGDMLRAARKAGTPLGKEADGYMSAGKLVPDQVVIGLVAERITEADAAKGFILDGFPRTVPQAEALGAMLTEKGLKLDCVVEIGVPRELLTERATLRRTDKRTGQIYHLKYSPPPPDAELEHRADDQEATVLKRLDEYDALTAALTPYYEKLGLLRRVDGVGKPAEVTQRILSALEKDQ
ncbi:MAG TPA: adenylate kinase [Polyangiaceae bacterium]|nr:adenylate kinase [Polyangiaceae bacterium]